MVHNGSVDLFETMLYFFSGHFLRPAGAAPDWGSGAGGGCGYLACRQAGVVPDLLLGDFDSMDQPEDFDRVRRMPVEKDDTDTMLAVKTGLEQGCGEFYLYGGTGGKRLDHTLANLQTLLYLRRRGAPGLSLRQRLRVDGH